jgi:acylphosphatase
LMRAHLVVSGRVQGVNYRRDAQRRASQLGLVGWVRNLPDGCVEAVAEGPAGEVDEFLDWCRRGPLLANVSNVEVSWEEPTGEHGEFRIIR